MFINLFHHISALFKMIKIKIEELENEMDEKEMRKMFKQIIKLHIQTLKLIFISILFIDCIVKL